MDVNDLEALEEKLRKERILPKSSEKGAVGAPPNSSVKQYYTAQGPRLK